MGRFPLSGSRKMLQGCLDRAAKTRVITQKGARGWTTQKSPSTVILQQQQTRAASHYGQTCPAPHTTFWTEGQSAPTASSRSQRLSTILQPRKLAPERFPPGLGPL